mmetsp:Transcript_61818/g.109761  ORF Transcript_61818/g.109761 Transcript_61818/m.109761 type:complete len:814 (-) Transcript_61818:129-2570(-)
MSFEALGLRALGLFLLCQLVPCFSAESAEADPSSEAPQGSRHMRREDSGILFEAQPEEAASRAVSAAGYPLGKNKDSIAGDAAAAASKVAAEKAKKRGESAEQVVKAAADAAIAAAKAEGVSHERVTLIGSAAAGKIAGQLADDEHKSVKDVAMAAVQAAARVARDQDFPVAQVNAAATAAAGRAAADAVLKKGASPDEVLASAATAAKDVAEVLKSEGESNLLAAVSVAENAGLDAAHIAEKAGAVAAASAATSPTNDAGTSAIDIADAAAESARSAAKKEGAPDDSATTVAIREAAAIAAAKARDDKKTIPEIQALARAAAERAAKREGLSNQKFQKEDLKKTEKTETKTSVTTVSVDPNGESRPFSRSSYKTSETGADNTTSTSTVIDLDLEATTAPAIQHLVRDKWACAYLCQAHADTGCCSFQTAPFLISSVDDTLGGYCMFSAGATAKDENATGWISADCEPGFQTSKCRNWTSGRCTNGQHASVGIPVWELVWEDDFDSLTCKKDSKGIYRPNPDVWTHEIGYKRSRERQWYQPDNAECRDGELVITAKRQRDALEASKAKPCKLKNWDNSPPNQVLSDEDCALCGPPHFKYDGACDLLQNDGSGAPACDCSQGAEFTSSALLTRGTKEFSYGLFEIKAKVSSHSGLWPSWWAVGDFDYVPWPKNGEIDILDIFQRVAKVAVFHANETGLPSGAVQHAAARLVDDKWEERYHIWQLEWDKDKIIIRIDAEDMLELDLRVADSSLTSWPNPFTNEKNFFMILNLAVGGHSGGEPSYTSFPGEFIVDYIRVYKKISMTPLGMHIHKYS